MTGLKRLFEKTLGFEGLQDPRNDWAFRLGLFFALVAMILRLFFWWYTQRVWEDALITVLHSENLVRGIGMTHYRAGQPPLHGFTSPLSVLVPLIGDLLRVGFGLSFIKIVSALIAPFTVLYAMAICVHPKVRLSWPLAGMVMGYLACEHHQILWGMAGMETQIATFILLASLYYLIAEKPLALGISLGFCMLARPDYAFWTVIAGLCVLFTRPRQLLTIVPVAIAVYLPWILFTTLYYGSPVPNTIVAKGLGYSLWTTAPDLTWAAWIRTALGRILGTYTSGTIFQPLGPSFAGHGRHFRAIINDHGAICNGMILLMLLGAIAALVRRQKAYAAMALFVLVYGVYYVFSVAIVFSWYIVPFIAMALLLSVRGLDALVSPIRNERARHAVLSGVALAYLGVFVAILPRTFLTEKRIQSEIEEPVRVAIGKYLHEVMKPDESIGCEPLGFIGYHSGRTVHDWPGLASREVVEYSRAHPDRRSLLDMLEALRPDFLVLRLREYANHFEAQWIDTDYDIVATFQVDSEKTADIWGVDTSIDLGFFVLAKKAIAARLTGPGGAPLGIRATHAEAFDAYGNRLMRQGRTAEAIAAFQAATTVRPGFAMAYNNLGAALIASGDLAGAERELRRAVELDPLYPQAFSNLGSLCAMRGDFVEAVKYFDRAVILQPRNRAAREDLERARSMLEKSPAQPSR